jgi:NAD(P)-dependent dehydrogenase (short-subunit alcohol dehydrogenase family)
LKYSSNSISVREYKQSAGENMFSLNGKKAFVTGGASGIGQAVAERFARAGASVTIADLQPPENNSSTLRYIELDVRDEAAVEQALAEASGEAGTLDILVNNAGVSLAENPISRTDVKRFDEVLSVNLKGVLHGLKHGPKFLRDGASIINTASLAATATVSPYTGYSVSKAGVLKLTQQSAIELGSRGIRVNAICPGTTTTALEPADSDESKLCCHFTALGRPGLPEEQAAVFHFLASDDSRYITGQAIYVDGGWLHGIMPATSDLLLSQRADSWPA